MLLPKLDKREGSIKELVIDSLGSQWPQTAKGLYNIVKTKGILVTYQAVYKTIKDLEADGMLSKTEKGYQLSVEWIKHLKHLSTKLENAYTKQIMIGSDKPTTLTFESLWDMYMFILRIYIEDTFKMGDKSICFQSQHIWYSLAGTEKEWGALEQFMKTHKLYAVTRSNTILDKIFQKNWERTGMKFKLGADVQSTTIMRDTVIVGDYVIQMFFPDALIREENGLYKKIKKIEDINTAELHAFFWKKYKWINVIIHKNKDVADQIRKETETYFR